MHFSSSCDERRNMTATQGTNLLYYYMCIRVSLQGAKRSSRYVLPQLISLHCRRSRFASHNIYRRRAAEARSICSDLA